VAKAARNKDTVAWTEPQVDRLLATTADHRWAIAFRLGVLYGLRRSEVLALRWDDLDVKASTLRIDESLVATNRGAAWGNAKNERSRCTIPIDSETMRVFARRRAEQAAERPRRREDVGRQRLDHRHPHGAARAPPLLRPSPGDDRG
jgi:integrase